MKLFSKIKSVIFYDTYGNIALASFLICAVSGVFLAIPYDVQTAYDSINLMLITNLPAVVFRNMHYWSAQFFLVFTLLHTWDHMKLESILKTKKGVWLRLVISLLFVFFVMLSGFIIKADADSLQARRILETLIMQIPLLGEFFVNILFGKKESFQLMYVHHIATATIFLVYIIYEHSRRLWSKTPTFLITLILVTVLSFFVHPPLHDNINPVLKGPWYFVGLQEILHWMSQPGWIWILVISLLIILYLMKNLGERSNRLLRKGILMLTFGYAVLTIIGFYFRGENWEWTVPWEKNKTESTVSLEMGFRKVNAQFRDLTANDIPLVQGKREACMNCHENVGGFAPAHDPSAIGCTSCHLGDPFSTDKKTAHENMVLIPGNLSNARLSCGTTECHPEITDRINKSLMTTNSGIVSVDRFVFGESHSPDVLAHIKEIGHSAADKHLRNLCAKCHLGNEKTETGPIDQLSRGGGCTACHLNNTKVGTKQHFQYLAENKKEEYLPAIHPSLDIKVSNDHCFGCHSRSGRISTNYEGWHETLLEETDIAGKEGYRQLQDKRVFEFISADVHHAAGMVCIDCHSSYELMGDGNLYAHKEQSVKVRCEDCHSNEHSHTNAFDELDSESRKIFELRNFTHNDKRMLKGIDSELALINTFIENGIPQMIGKNSGNVHPLNPPSDICTKEHVHASLTCSSCHTAWAPQCIGCHNEFDRESRGFDQLEKMEVQGEWVEYVAQFYADLPTLGVRESDDKKIEPAIPGMIMTIDKGSYYSSDDFKSSDESVIFHRLYAPTSPHTTSIQGRNCVSCHNDPLAIGYGRGRLEYMITNGKGSWKFTPQFEANKNDGLPEDAWIGFLMETKNLHKPAMGHYASTRTDFRPFSLEEQKRILTVGTCLTCHDENSQVMINSMNEAFENYLLKISEQCILPEW